MNGVGEAFAIKMFEHIKDNCILLIIGESGSGKTTLANDLERFGLNELISYTTRPKRHENESSHIFVTEEEFDKLNCVAYSEYNGYKYGATKEQIEKANTYVIDVAGLKYFEEHYDGDRTPIIIRTNVPEDIRIARMAYRGDDEESIVKRLKLDRIEFDNEKIFNTKYTVLRLAREQE